MKVGDYFDGEKILWTGKPEVRWYRDFVKIKLLAIFFLDCSGLAVVALWLPYLAGDHSHRFTPPIFLIAPMSAVFITTFIFFGLPLIQLTTREFLLTGTRVVIRSARYGFLRAYKINHIREVREWLYKDGSGILAFVVDSSSAVQDRNVPLGMGHDLGGFDGIKDAHATRQLIEQLKSSGSLGII